MTYEQAKDDINLLFSRNEKAKAQVAKFIKDLSDAIRDFHYLIRGASILICLDENTCNVKLIDLASIEKNGVSRSSIGKNGEKVKNWISQIDLGFQIGLKNLGKILDPYKPIKRRFIIGGNWKCNGTMKSNEDLIKNVLSKVQFKPEHGDVVVSPIALHLTTVQSKVDKKIQVAC